MAVKKLITVGYQGFIPELRTNGPIKTPTMVNINAVRALVLNGRRVYEHNPSNPSKKVLLTPSNIGKPNFSSEDVKVDEVKKTDDTPATVKPVDPTPVAPVNPEPEKKEEEAPVTPEEKVETLTEEPKVEETPADDVTPVTPVEETKVDTPVVENTEPSKEEAPAEETPVENTPVSQNTNTTSKKKNKKK